MQFVDYNKHPIQILGAVCADIRSAGWEVKDAYFLVTERRARCILGLDLLGQKVYTGSEGMKQQFYKKFSSLFERRGVSDTGKR